MGRVAVRAKIWNFEDELRAIRGEIAREAVRSIEVEGLVDTGATILVLPEELVERLGLLIDREVTVTHANNSRARKKVARGAVVEILGRIAMVDCIVEEPGARVLIGQVPLEVMDLVVDPKQGTIGPRPESPDMPLIELYCHLRPRVEGLIPSRGQSGIVADGGRMGGHVRLHGASHWLAGAQGGTRHGPRRRG